MDKPVVEVRTVYMSGYDAYYEDIEIYLNGEKIADGSFGGEPEDNCRYRTYTWVDDAIQKVAEKLGAEVQFTEQLED